MADGLLVIYMILKKWLVPFIFAIGLIYFVYGTIVYYIVGHKGGDEGEMQKGRDALVKGFGFLLIAIMIQLLVLGIGWLGTVLSNSSAGGGVDGGGTSVQQQKDVLDVPNVPSSND